MSGVTLTRRAAIVITVAVMCGVFVGISVYVSLTWTARAQATRLSQVTATVVQRAVPERSHPAIGRWTATDGVQRTGVIPAPPDHTTGMTYPIWIDGTGHVAAPPKSPLHRGTQAALAGSSVAIAIIILFAWRTGTRTATEDPAVR